MRLILSALGLVLSAAFGALAVAMSLHAAWAGVALFLAAALVAFPGARRLVGVPLPGWVRAGLATALAAGFYLWLGSAERDSIYRSPAVAAELERIYEDKLADWPLPYEERYLDTSRGRVHVVVSGPADAPPLLLLHAGGAASWSWTYNVGELSRSFRTYAIDRIGDPGRSSYAGLAARIRTPREVAAHQVEVMDLLGIKAAHVVGASQGGYEAYLLATFHPDRVRRMVLLAPLGLPGTSRAALRLGLAYLFPLRPVVDATFRYAFSEDRRLRTDFAEWFPLTLSGTLPANPVLRALPEDQREAMVRPVLFVFGSRDRVVGDPAAASAEVSPMPNAEVAVVEGGHLLAGERPEEVNRLILDFLSGD